MVAVTVIAVAAGAAARGIGGKRPSTPARSKLPPATAQVTKATLTQTERVSGTLGYGATSALSVPTAAGGGAGGAGPSGTITWLPDPGSVVSRGKPAYKVDDKPVPLIYGTLPLYRSLSAGFTGTDVKELEQNLSALGYTGFTVDDQYSAATATAVKKWQADLGLTTTGTVDPSQVAMAPDAIRVVSLKAGLGRPATGDVLTYAATVRVVTIPLDVGLQSLVKTGLAVTVTLPDGKVVDGTVQAIGTAATTNDKGTTIDVIVGLSDPNALGTLDNAPVGVMLISGQATDVLVVPVEALLALAEGGYGVQVVTGSDTRYVPVKTGMFANGRVEITGDGIAAGTMVGVPA
ncbi:peptidoglycan-binding protein [Dactylosporangium cerinum]|uniref:Peptidoglycan-binding protein n=1 Tax=Dactylosporangium cerinum TaxID=1434730 RepID=A0ABV9VJ05_9ACTN